jgi:SnoaL-like domain
VSAARLGLVVLLAIALVDCAKVPKQKAEKKPAPEPTDPVSKIKKVVRLSYDAVCALEPERLEELMIDQVVGYGFGPVDYVQNRRAAIDEARQQLLPFGLHGDTLTVVKSRPRVGLADDGQSAWVWDFPHIVQERGNGKGTRTWLPRVTLHLVLEGRRWRIDAFHLSYGYPDADLYAAEAEKSLISPATLDLDKGPNSDQAVGLARRLLEDITVKVDRVADHDDVLLLGTDSGDVFEGGRAFKDFAQPKLAELKKAPFSLRMDGGPVARLAPGGKTAWVFATVQLRLGVGKNQKTLVPFRAFWVFAEKGGMLDLVLEHQSLALKVEQRRPATAEELKAKKDDPAPAASAVDGGSEKK